MGARSGLARANPRSRRARPAARSAPADDIGFADGGYSRIAVVRWLPHYRQVQPPPVPIDDTYLAIVPSLKARFPAFALSPAYSLVAGNDDLPGVILAAFASYLIDVWAKQSDPDEVTRGIAAIGTLYGSQDYRIQSAILNEFIEAFDGNPLARQAVSPFLTEELAEAFARVLG